MFYVSFLHSNIFVYDTMTCNDKKKNACFKSQKYHFLGLTEAAFAGKILGFLGMFFMLLEKTLS